MGKLGKSLFGWKQQDKGSPKALRSLESRAVKSWGSKREIMLSSLREKQDWYFWKSIKEFVLCPKIREICPGTVSISIELSYSIGLTWWVGYGRMGIGIIQGELKMPEPKHREVRLYKNVNGGISPGGLKRIRGWEDRKHRRNCPQANCSFWGQK